MTDVLVALSGLPDEPELVRSADAVGLRILRRCVDAVDLLAAAAIADRCPVIVSATLPRLTADVVDRLGARPIVGVASDALGAQRLERLGVDPVVVVAPAPLTTMQQVADVCAVARPASPSAPPPVGLEEVGIAGPDVHAPRAPGVQGGSGTASEHGPEPSRSGRHGGRVITVWGPLGSPGRTTVALGVSEHLARQGRRVCLVDADTYGPSVALALGLVEDTSGLLIACRHADAGSLSVRALASLTMSVPVAGAGDWRVLGGLGDPARWRELRRSALDRLWPQAREAFDVTVVDAGFCLESDDDAGAWTRERNAAGLSAVSEADHVLAVGDSSVLGAARLATAVTRLRQVAPQAAVSVVRNRARGSAGQWRDAISPLVPEAEVVDVPEDARALQACWSQGRPLGEVARRSRIRRAMEQVAAVAVSG